MPGRPFLFPGGHSSPCHMSSPFLLLRDSTNVADRGGWCLILVLAKVGDLIISHPALILIFHAKVSAILRMWRTLYQYLHRHIFLNVLSMWVYGPKDDTHAEIK